MGRLTSFLGTSRIQFPGVPNFGLDHSGSLIHVTLQIIKAADIDYRKHIHEEQVNDILVIPSSFSIVAIL